MIKVWDYGTDDTAVRGAVSDAKTRGESAIYFGPGTYTVDGTGDDPAKYWLTNGIALDFPVTIEIHPKATIQHVATLAPGHCVFDVTGSRGVTIRGGGTIRGDYGEPAAGTGYGFGTAVKGRGVSRLTIEDLTISGFRGDGIALGVSTTDPEQNRNITVRRCSISGNARNGVSVGGAHRLLIRGCAFADNGREIMPKADVCIEGTGGPTDTAGDVWIDRNTFSATPAQAVVISSSVTNASITRNTFTGCRRAFNLSSRSLSSARVTFSHNVVQGTPASLMGAALASPSALGVTVSNNIFRDLTDTDGPNYSAAIYAAGKGVSIVGARITGNTFINCKSEIKAADSLMDATVTDNVDISTVAPQ